MNPPIHLTDTEQLAHGDGIGFDQGKNQGVDRQGEDGDIGQEKKVESGSKHIKQIVVNHVPQRSHPEQARFGRFPWHEKQ